MPPAETSPRSGGNWVKLGVIAFIAAAAGIAWWQFGDQLSLGALAERESQLRTFQDEHPVLVCGIAFLAYVSITGLSLPGATGLTLVYGWYFGLARALLLVSFASTSGATVAFLLSRYLLRDTVQSRFGDRLEKFNDALEKEGAFYLFTLRLIPAVPFFVINLVMGLTPVRTRTFWSVSQLGMLPGTCVYVYAGSVVPDLQTLADKGIRAVLTPTQLTQILLAFVMLGVFPLVVKKLMQRFKPEAAESNAAGKTANESPDSETPLSPPARD